MVAGNVTGITTTGVYNVTVNLWTGGETVSHVEIPGSPFQVHIVNDDIDSAASELAVSQEVIVAGGTLVVSMKSFLDIGRFGCGKKHV